ncbi:response regulator, partial [Endothiovibrio diazotrophicus]
MQSPIDYQRFAVLFVDDEEPALRVFKRYYSRDLRVFTAPSVDAATEVLEAHGGEIGVLLTDQRMPGKPGVELLDRVREHHPEIVRILTTGYTNLPETIEAVNRGEIHRYIPKPWKPEQLLTELKQALELFALRRERDLLLEEKLSVRQRQAQTDRMRDLLTMIGSLHRLRRSRPALRAFVTHLTDLAAAVPGTASRGWEPEGAWETTHRETDSLFWLGRHIARLLDGDYALDEEIEPLSTLEGVFERIDSETERRFPPTLPAIRGNRGAFSTLIGLLLQEAEKVRSEPSPVLAAEEENDGIRLTVDVPGPVCFPAEGSLLTSAPPGIEATGRPFHGDLFTAYLITYHLGGAFKIRYGDGLTYQVELPADPLSVEEEEMEPDWMDEVLVRFEGWGE